MSDKRYYYTDPLAAAWMAKHFGMRFQYAQFQLTDLITPTSYCDFDQGHDNTCYWDLDVNDAYPRYFIHPASLPLLEAQILDVIMCRHFGPSTARMVNNDTQRELARNYQSRIIQRNGIPFHWPESEQA